MKRNSRGFALVDMISTMFIFMGIGLIAMPVFSEIMKGYKLHGATRQVLAEMQKTRMTAIMENRPCRAHMQSGDLMFQCRAANADTWDAVADQSIRADDTAGMTLSTPDIVFSPNGTATSSGSLTIADATGKYRTIVVSPAGSIRIN